MRRFALTAAFVVAGLTVAAQRQAFEVAVIKRNDSANAGASVNGNAGRLTVRNSPLRNLIRNAWGLQTFQIIGGPDWIDMERWDIAAKVEAGAERQSMLPMMQNLLADRFKLVTHRETRELPIYALVLARADRSFGPKLHASSTDCQKEMTAAIARGGPPGPNSPLLCGIRSIPGHFELNAAALNNFTRTIAPLVGRQVVDKTGLTGVFDADLTWNDSEEGPSLFTAIQEQLGLKFDAQRGPVEVLVIDSVQRPVED